MEQRTFEIYLDETLVEHGTPEQIQQKLIEAQRELEQAILQRDELDEQCERFWLDPDLVHSKNEQWKGAEERFAELWERSIAADREVDRLSEKVNEIDSILVKIQELKRWITV